MGLDAVVHCRCHEDGKLRTPAPTECRVGGSGELEAITANFEEVLRFDRWRKDACEHEDGVAIRRRLGNAATIACIRQKLEGASDRFPLLLRCVVYDGSHTGDHIEASSVARLAVEVDAISALSAASPDEERDLAAFAQSMRALIEVAERLGKPIAF